MQFHNYLEHLLGSKVKIKVLRTLWKHQEKEFTIRELSRFLGVSHTGIKKILNELEKANAITLRTLGRSHAFKLNNTSYAADILNQIFEMEKRALSELKNMIKRRFDSTSITSVALFGSIAEGKETLRSDIDLLIVTNQREKAEETIVKLQKEITEKFGNPISAYYISTTDIGKKRRRPPIRQALQNHILICGKPLSENHVNKS